MTGRYLLHEELEVLARIDRAIGRTPPGAAVAPHLLAERAAALRRLRACAEAEADLEPPLQEDAAGALAAK